MSRQLELLESEINYFFKDKDLLSLALTHSSMSSTNNENLELLGDSLIGLAVTNFLFHEFNDQDEGLLSLWKSKLVSRSFLSKVAKRINLGDFIKVGKSVANDQNKSHSILGNTFEALLGAVFLDSDFVTASNLTIALIADEIGTLSLDDTKDSKTLLQEELQKRKLSTPNYNTDQIDANEKNQFKSTCEVKTLNMVTEGVGRNKKEADQEAALKMLNKLTEND
jgi:ribonuclease-3